MALKEKYGSYEHVGSGKVRDIYRNTAGKDILLVASDRVSAFDQKLGVVVPDKGKILTAISAKMFQKAERWWGFNTAFVWATPTPMRPLDWDRMHDLLDGPEGPATERPVELAGRMTQMDALEMLPVECVVRGHISGSAWKLYAAGEREICGVPLPEGLKNGDKLPKPIFTPTTKAPEGQHDENINFGEMAKILYDWDLASEVFSVCLSLYDKAYEFFLRRGLILADTKFELGLNSDGKLAFGDEILTPDSSRFWDAETFVPGEGPLSFDKQIIRNCLAEAKARGETDFVVPDEILYQTRIRYVELYERITDHPWSE